MNEVKVDDLWDYFVQHRLELANSYHMIASSEDGEFEIYLTDEYGFPAFSIEYEEEEIYFVETCSALDAKTTYEDLLHQYIYKSVISSDDSGEYEDEEDDAVARCEEISCAVYDLLYVLLEARPESCDFTDEDYDKIASVVEQHLFDNYGISVRHPTEADGAIIEYPFGEPDQEEAENEGLPDYEPI